MTSQIKNLNVYINGWFRLPTVQPYLVIPPVFKIYLTFMRIRIQVINIYLRLFLTEEEFFLFICLPSFYFFLLLSNSLMNHSEIRTFFIISLSFESKRFFLQFWLKFCLWIPIPGSAYFSGRKNVPDPKHRLPLKLYRIDTAPLSSPPP